MIYIRYVCYVPTFTLPRCYTLLLIARCTVIVRLRLNYLRWVPLRSCVVTFRVYLPVGYHVVDCSYDLLPGALLPVYLVAFMVGCDSCGILVGCCDGDSSLPLDSGLVWLDYARLLTNHTHSTRWIWEPTFTLPVTFMIHCITVPGCLPGVALRYVLVVGYTVGCGPVPVTPVGGD